MSSVAVQHNLAFFIEALLAGDSDAIEQKAHEVLKRAEDTSELIGQIGLLAMQGDSDGHITLALGAASALTRWLISLRHVFADSESQPIGVPLLVQALNIAAPAVKIGQKANIQYPKAFFPSELPPDETVSSAILKAIYNHDTTEVERMLFGLYATGADYRTISVRIYDGISQIFQENGHTLLFAARGSQVLDAVRWGPDAPHYLHWLAPHLALHEDEPEWIKTVRNFLSEPEHSLASYRTRLAAPQNASALPLRELLLSDASTQQVCQAVYDALMTNGASATGVGSIIALAATDLLQSCNDEDRDLFVRAAHGLILASATRLVYTQVQEVETLPLLFTAASYLTMLHKELASQIVPGQPAAQTHSGGGGLIAPSLLESLHEQIVERNLAAAIATVHRYIQLGNNAHALFAIIGLGAALTDAAADQGHTLQIVQAAGDAYLTWPADLAQINRDGFLQVALRAAALGKRSS